MVFFVYYVGTTGNRRISRRFDRVVRKVQMLRKLFGALSVLSALFLTGWFGRVLYLYISDDYRYWNVEDSMFLVGGTAAGLICLVAASVILRRRAIDRLVEHLIWEASTSGTSEQGMALRKAFLRAILNAAQNTGFSPEVLEGTLPEIIDDLAALFHKNSAPNNLRAALAREGGKKWLKGVTASSS